MASCAKRGEPFVRGGQLSNAEKQSISRIHPSLANWRPDYSVLWSRDGVVRHIYFHRYEITSIGWPYQVFTFDGDGSVVEANVLDGPNNADPKSILGISPLQVRFVGTWGSRTVDGFRYSREEGRSELQKECEDMDKWIQSLDTNRAKLHSTVFEVQPGKTNSPK